MAFTEKCCSVCGVVNWDSMQGNHGHSHENNGTKRDKIPTHTCDTNGEVRKWDAHGHRIYD
jgi:hypothetical protein